jgi:hypothetical protein
MGLCTHACETAPGIYATKRPNDEHPNSRAPPKRQAFDLGGPPTRAPLRAAPPGPRDPRSEALPTTHARMPHNRAPFNPSAARAAGQPGAPPGAAPRTQQPPLPPQPRVQPTPQPRTNPPPPPADDRFTPIPADALADTKGKELALRACREIKVDGVKESSVCVPAVLTCAAGYLVGGQSGEALLEKGRDLARKVGSYMQRIGAAPLSLPRQDEMMTCAVPNMLAPKRLSPGIYTKAKGAPAARDKAPGKLHKYTVCQTPVEIEGQPVLAVLDSGASRSVITTHTVRELGLEARVDPTPVAYFNADGFKAQSPGQIRGLAVQIGTASITVDPVLSNADTYHCLLGNDALGAAGAVIDFGRRRVNFATSTDPAASWPIFFGASEANHVQVLTATTSHLPSSPPEPASDTSEGSGETKHNAKVGQAWGGLAQEQMGSLPASSLVASKGARVPSPFANHAGHQGDDRLDEVGGL